MSKLDQFLWNLSFPKKATSESLIQSLNKKLFKESILNRTYIRITMNKDTDPGFVPNPLCMFKALGL